MRYPAVVATTVTANQRALRECLRCSPLSQGVKDTPELSFDGLQAYIYNLPTNGDSDRGMCVHRLSYWVVSEARHIHRKSQDGHTTHITDSYRGINGASFDGPPAALLAFVRPKDQMSKCHAQDCA